MQAGLLKSNYRWVVLGDLKGSGWIKAAQRTRPDIIVHLAAESPNSFYGDEARRLAESNSQIDYNVFKFCTETGTGLIYASGTSVYGFEDGRIKRESGDIDPVGPYVEQKAESERVGLELFPLRGLQFAALRICAPYGPGQNARTVLNIFIERALNGMPLLYHGTGSRQQDYSYISDIATVVSLV
jgi:nucleoside-diphosphate-sugar epimerase